VYFGKVARTACLLLAMGAGLTNPSCPADTRPFTVADDIELTHFGDPVGLKAAPVTFSPDCRYFVVDTERGLLDQNRPESTLRFFRTEEIHQFLLHPEMSGAPDPIWVVRMSTYKDGPIITNIRWLANSKGVAFLSRAASGNNQLFLADLKTKTIHALTPENQDVTGFDIRDRSHLIYSVLSPRIMERALAEREATTIIGTGRSLEKLLFPEDLYPFMLRRHDLSELWAILDGRKFRVGDKSSGRALPLYLEGQSALALSPDGRSVVTALAVTAVPEEWIRLYPPPLIYSGYRITSGPQDVEAFDGQRYISEYVVIDLSTGGMKPLIDAPTGNSLGWTGAQRPSWSGHGRWLALPDAFVPPDSGNPHNLPSAPCVAVVNLENGRLSCAERYKGWTKEGGFETGWRYIESVRFADTGRPRLVVNYLLPDFSKGSMEYALSGDGSWTASSKVAEFVPGHCPIDVSVKQSLNDPPVLVATDDTGKTSRTILDPNPQLRNIDLGEASVFKWKDQNDRDFVGGLYKPPNYVRGKRYPLVIQTHGFSEYLFRPDGNFPTAFAARELAAAGILVLQVQDCSFTVNPEEGTCNLAGYEAAVNKLVIDGLIDADRIGIVGFSRSCYYVMEELTTGTVHFAAASITDGFNVGYLQYIAGIDDGRGSTHEANVMIGAPPFGSGLAEWLKRSPEFKMDKVTTPLQVVAIGRTGVLSMWEPYAALRFLNKPVDLAVLADGTHVLTNPAQRMVSQGGTVDWFRFWLKGEEEPDPKKAEQYARWRILRKLQEEGQKARSKRNSS
jgi:hypothetical protein